MGQRRVDALHNSSKDMSAGALEKAYLISPSAARRIKSQSGSEGRPFRDGQTLIQATSALIGPFAPSARTTRNQGHFLERATSLTVEERPFKIRGVLG